MIHLHPMWHQARSHDSFYSLPTSTFVRTDLPELSSSPTYNVAAWRVRWVAEGNGLHAADRMLRQSRMVPRSSSRHQTWTGISWRDLPERAVPPRNEGNRYYIK